MTIVSFYSFKGGVGRTFTALEAAAQLARNGRSVCIWDLDLEAPALHRHAQLADLRVQLRTGTLDLLEGAAVDGAVSPDAVDDAVVKLHGTDYEVSFLMAAGTACLTADEASNGRSYAERYWAIDWGADYASNRAQNSFLSIADHLADRFDVVVIDARTGLTDLGYLSSRLLADAVVIVFGMSDQNVEGLRTAHQAITRAVGSEPPPRTLLVANLVPDDVERASNPRITTAYDAQTRRLSEHGLAADVELPLVPARLIDDLVPSLDGGLGEEAVPFRPVVRWIEEVLPAHSMESEDQRTGPMAFEQDVLGLLHLLGWELLEAPESDRMFDALLVPPSSALVRRSTILWCVPSLIDLASISQAGDALRRVEGQGGERLEALLVSRRNPSVAVAEEARRRGVAVVSTHQLVDQLFDVGPMLRALEKQTPVSGAFRYAERQGYEMDGAPGSMWLIEELNDLALEAEPGLTCVVGPPGSGKSTVLRQLVARLGSIWHSSVDFEHRVLPVLVTAADIRAAELEPIEDLVVRVAASYGIATTTEVVHYLRRTRRLVILIDGVDEIAPDALVALALQDAASRGPVIATCRSARFAELAGLQPARMVTLLGIEQRELGRLLEQTFGTREAEQVRTRLAADPSLAALVSLPLGLQLLMDHAEVSAQDLTLSVLIAQAMEHWLSETPLSSPEDAAVLLGEMASALHVSQRSSIGLTTIEELWSNLPGHMSDDVHRTLATCPFLRRIGVEDYGFTHRVLAEWFLGRSLASADLSYLMHGMSIPRLPAFAVDVWAEVVEQGRQGEVEEALTSVHLADPATVPNSARVNSFLLLRALGATGSAPPMQLGGADLAGLDLSNTDLSSAWLVGADLRSSALARSDLRSANADHARLDHADLEGANLTGASLVEARLVDARLGDAVLCQASMRGADLRRAYLRRADLSFADLRGADLGGADFKGADLNGVRLDSGQSTAVGLEADPQPPDR